MLRGAVLVIGVGVIAVQSGKGQLCDVLTRVASPNAGGDANFLLGVSAMSADEAWAVGRYRSGSSQQPLSLHWNGAAWSVVVMPTPTAFGGVPQADLRSVKAFSHDEVWAVGSYPGTESAAQETIAYRWSGSAWLIVPSPAGRSGSYGSAFFCVDGVAADDFWAVGHIVSPAQGTQPLAARWNGSGWEEHRLPNASAGATEALQDLHVRGVDDIWALEVIGVGPPTNPKRVFHWNGSSWSEGTTRLNSLRYAAADAIHAFGPDDVWVSAVVQSTFQVVALHWNGSTWTEHVAPVYASEFFGDASNDLYGVGSTAIMHWNGSNWSIAASLGGVPEGNFFDAHRAADGTIWCAGTTAPGAPARTLIARVDACAPVCAADFNGDGVVNSQDFFEFVAAFIAPLPSADFNRDGMVSSPDFFEFLSAFFVGC